MCWVNHWAPVGAKRACQPLCESTYWWPIHSQSLHSRFPLEGRGTQGCRQRPADHSHLRASPARFPPSSTCKTSASRERRVGSTGIGFENQSQSRVDDSFRVSSRVSRSLWLWSLFALSGGVFASSASRSSCRVVDSSRVLSFEAVCQPRGGEISLYQARPRSAAAQLASTAHRPVPPAAARLPSTPAGRR